MPRGEILETDLSDLRDKLSTAKKEHAKAVKESAKYEETRVARVPVKKETSKEIVLSRDDKIKIRQEALAIADELGLELKIPTLPVWDTPNTWSYFSVDELARGDGILIDGAIYVYLKKMAWWRNKTANILVAQHHNPDKQKRIGELDYVYAYKGYVRDQQLSKLGVDNPWG